MNHLMYMPLFLAFVQCGFQESSVLQVLPSMILFQIVSFLNEYATIYTFILFLIYLQVLNSFWWLQTMLVYKLCMYPGVQVQKFHLSWVRTNWVIDCFPQWHFSIHLDQECMKVFIAPHSPTTQYCQTFNFVMDSGCGFDLHVLGSHRG